MPFKGDTREVRLNYECHHCHRQGIGFKTEIYDGKFWNRQGENSIPPNWRTFGLGTHLCDRCVDNPEATQSATKSFLVKLAVVAVLVIIALIVYAIQH